MVEGNKILAITNENKGSAEQREFATEVDTQISHLKENYYKWLARLVILFAIVSMSILMSASLVLFNLAPKVEVEPFLIVQQDSSNSLVRYEPIEFNMPSRKQLMTSFIKQYVTIRNSIISDELEMQVRWFPGGLLHYLSGDDVFSEFNANREKTYGKALNIEYTREVEIISISKQGGENSPVWKVDFKTYDLMPRGLDGSTLENRIVVRYWTASITCYFIRGRELISRRLINPLGFTVVRYSQAEVEVL